MARRHLPALIILDIVLPGMDGLEVCRQIRSDPLLAPIPIIFLSKRSACMERVLGLNQGGDDYLPKPFDVQELKARILALLRRSQPASLAEPPSPAHPKTSVLALGGLQLDLRSRQVIIGNRHVDLTSAEFDLLYFLLTHAGCVFTSQELIQQVWHYPPETTSPGLVRWHVKNLRAKIENDPQHPAWLRTVAHQGYIFNCAI
jgi:two-component system, OmpR family, response regulator RpaA